LPRKKSSYTWSKKEGSSTPAGNSGRWRGSDNPPDVEGKTLGMGAILAELDRRPEHGNITVKELAKDFREASPQTARKVMTYSAHEGSLSHSRTRESLYREGEQRKLSGKSRAERADNAPLVRSPLYTISLSQGNNSSHPPSSLGL